MWAWGLQIMKLLRPSTPEPCSPRTYVAKKEEILDRVRKAIKARKWECQDLHAVYPSIRKKKFDLMMDEEGLEDWRFSMRYACGVTEAVGIDPWNGGPPMVLPVPAPLPTIQYVHVKVPVPAPSRRHQRGPIPGQLALDLAA